MRQLSSAGQQAVFDIAQRHGFSPDAVMHMLDAVVRGNGNAAQFSHPEFSGAGQWMRGGMTMVSDMFNNVLKGRVDSLCSELANLVASQPDLLQSGGSFQSQTQGTPVPAVGWGAPNGGGSTHSSGSGGNNLFAPAPPDWWGPDLKYPNSTGSQNGARYAYFAQARRLAVEAGGSVFIYDTLDHQIGGFSQQQGPNGSMTCSSQYGTVALNSLPVVAINGVSQVPLAPSAATWQAAPAPTGSMNNNSSNAPSGDVLGMIQKLSELHAAGVLTADEFGAKKAELLGRL